MTQKNSSSAKSGMILGGIAVLAFAAWASYRFTATAPANDGATASIEQSQRLPTLDPARFDGKTRDAYQAARDVPEVLEQVPCYCGCMSNAGHRNNLDCFTDDHGMT